jgi:HK97 family phage portal protein
MKIKNPFKRKKGNRTSTAFITMPEFGELTIWSGYTRLDRCPEIVTACKRISELIASMTIHLMANSEIGDTRIVNELSRKIDINPNRYMTRKTFIETVVMNLLLYGNGNSVVKVHTSGGLLGDLEPIAPDRVSIIPDPPPDYGYHILIDGSRYEPDDLLHFTYNPDERHPFIGKGLRVQLKTLSDNLKQAETTKNAFLKSEWKPSLIVQVDSLVDEFSTPEGRQKIIDQYIKSGKAGEPWLLPSEQFDIKEIRPLSLTDLAINDSVELDKKAVAAIIGVPPFLLGVGEYNRDEWNNFIQSTIRPIARGLEQEMTRKLILSDKWYLRFNVLSLMDYDVETKADIMCALSDRGFVTGNEVRDEIGMSPKEGLDELRTLENYIPNDKLGDQKKLIQDKKSGG